MPYKDSDVAREYKREWARKHVGYFKERYHARKNDPEFKKIKWAAKLFTLYRIREPEYQALLDAQDNQCAICHTEFVETPCVDHDHQTDRVRGLLCWNCNVGIGNLKDDFKILQSAIDYLVYYRNRHEERPLSLSG